MTFTSCSEDNVSHLEEVKRGLFSLIDVYKNLENPEFSLNIIYLTVWTKLLSQLYTEPVKELIIQITLPFVGSLLR